MDVNQVYLDNQRLIYKKSHEFSNYYNIPYEFVEGKALEVFCIALNEYDISRRIKFSTFLYNCLSINLNQYCKRQKKRESIVDFIDHHDLIKYNKTFRDESKEFIEFTLFLESNQELCQESKKIIFDLLYGKFNYTGKFSHKLICNKYGFESVKSKYLYKKISTFWKKYEKKYLYCS